MASRESNLPQGITRTHDISASWRRRITRSLPSAPHNLKKIPSRTTSGSKEVKVPFTTVHLPDPEFGSSRNSNRPRRNFQSVSVRQSSNRLAYTRPFSVTANPVSIPLGKGFASIFQRLRVSVKGSISMYSLVSLRYKEMRSFPQTKSPAPGYPLPSGCVLLKLESAFERYPPNNPFSKL